ncbi:MAG: glycosyltransferase family 4 protein [Hydrogenophaga sp.]|uniref:glycosyltransferase family 4 protein n=1 Tax=Hydrogenophaga sp. TaxID=1904254 RepID=UPI002601EDCE|nr:glycosyltransferase family 4 protein [Hydrogenophaga sp.]MDM7943747.1 glycosyltransferase family 4 protein [Hydrogenophaga sp.]
MKVLLLSFYFPPDLSAGSFRMEALVASLLQHTPKISTITVITTSPNRYGSFEAPADANEMSGSVNIHRIQLPPHRSGMLDQARAFGTFAWKARALVQRERPDVVVATTSRLMTGVLGAWAARHHKAPFYLDIRDIFVDTIGDVLSPRSSFLLKPLLSALERWAVNSASKVNLVSPGFLPYFEPRYPGRSFSLLSNGVDDAFIDHLWGPEGTPCTQNRPINVLYAGNIGEGQGLHNILPELTQRLGPSVHFTVVGDGGRRAALEAALAVLPRHAVTLRNPVKRAELIQLYQEADVLFVHLNDLPAFEKVLPSKLFEYAATGKPIWAGLAGFPSRFAHDEIENVAVFQPCDSMGAARSLETLKLQTIDRSHFIDKYRRTTIMGRMAGEIGLLASEHAQPSQVLS